MAPAYHDFDLLLRFDGPEKLEMKLPSGNRRWMPTEDGKTHTETYEVQTPSTLRPGRYDVKLKLFSPAARRDVLLALDEELRDEDGWYRVAAVEVE